jgi:transcriptional regulator with PAS, ATPase and Fis domain
MLFEQFADILLKDIHHHDIPTAGTEISLGKSMKIMLENHTQELALLNGAGNFAGILTLAGAAKMASLEDNPPKTAGAAAIRLFPQLPKVESKTKALDALALMTENGLDFLPIVDQGRFNGIAPKTAILTQVYARMIDGLTTTLHTIHESVCVVDRDGIVIMWSKGSEKLLNIKQEKIVGKPLADFFPNALLLRVLQEREELKNYYHSPREGCYVVVSAMPLYMNGEFVGAVSTDKDATETTNLIFELEETRDKLLHLQNEVSVIEDRFSFDQVVGRSKIIQEKIQRAKHVAKTKASVLIIGESGTGKEIFARAIHKESGRKGPFVAVNCSAIPESLFESEMFGYVGGAFTGALKKGKLGKFELANEGTLFFDEIGDMPLYMQAKILRALQERHIVRIGGEKPIPVDVRVISATHQNLDKMVSEGKFREDLYYRLNVVKLDLPPLRARKDDIPILVSNFIQEFCRENNVQIPLLTPEILAAVMQHDWKGNIRELKNTVEHLVIFSKKGRIELSSAPEFLLQRSARVSETDPDYDLEKSVAQAEIDIIEKVMKIAGGNKSKAAKLLGLPRSTLYYKLNAYNIKSD